MFYESYLLIQLEKKVKKKIKKRDEASGVCDEQEQHYNNMTK